MNRCQRIFYGLLLSIFSIFRVAAGQFVNTEADSIFQPPRRVDPHIEYRTVTAGEVLDAPNNSKRGAAGLAVALSPGHAIFLLPSGRTLVGKVKLVANPAASFFSDSIHVAVRVADQTASADTFRTVARGFLRIQGEFESTFPGEYATAIEVVFDRSQAGSEPVSAIQVSAIELSAETRIMLIGDSITNGKSADDSLGYRKELYHLLIAKGVSIDFVGGYGEAPYEAHFQGGRKIQDFYPISLGGSGKMDVTGDMDNYRPNVAAIHLGTNNLADGLDGPVGPYGTGMQFNSTPAGAMAVLVNYLLKWHNGDRGNELQQIFVSQIVPIKYQDSLVIHFNIEVARLVRDFQQGLITGHPEPVFLTDHFTRFFEDPALGSTYYQSHMYDRLHPNTYGHHVMAVTYLNSIFPVMAGQWPWFSDVSWESGIAGNDNHFGGQGVAVADVNGDGREDLYTTRIAIRGLDRRDFYYQNNANGVFQEKGAALNIQDAGDSRGVLFADIEHDGDLDLFNANSPGRNRLYDNLQKTTFQEITAISGLENLDAVSTALIAFDCENDGDLDLFAVNSRTLNEFYLNNGAGRFSRKDRGANDVEEPEIASVSAAGADFDMDGDVDLYIVKRQAANKLFINDGAGYFTEGAGAAGLAFNHKSNAAVWADFDNDGDPDLVISVSNTTSDPTPILHFFRNNGNGVFQDVSMSVNIPMDGYSPLVGDFDNDGDYDLITTGERNSGALYRNNGNWNFIQVTDTGAEIFAGDVRGGTVFDYDNDGDLDIYAARADVFNVLRKNNLNTSNHYLKIDASGPGGEEGGIGTKLWLYSAGQLASPAALLGYREIVSSGGHISQYSLTQHFGLNSRTSADLLAQFTDGTLLALRNVGADQTLAIEPGLAASPGGEPASVTVFSGQNQIDTVGQVLPLPLIARVANASGGSLAGIRVDYSVVSGDAVLIAPQAGSGGIWFEAENGRLGGGLNWAYDATCANGGLVMPSPLKPIAGYDTLTVEVTTPGPHQLWIRFFNPANSGNFYYQFDSGAKQSVALSTTSGWTWFKLSTTGGIILTAGTHQLVLETTFKTIQIDRLLLSPDSQYIPSGLGDENGAGSFTSDRDGLASRFLQLGSTAGPVVVQARVGETLTAAFYATAKPGAAFSINETSGNNQIGTAGVPMGQPFVVTVRDAFANPVSGKRVVFTVRSGGGTLMPSTGQVDTDAAGQAKVTITPGTASSSQQVSAEATLVNGSPVLFNITVPGIAANLVYQDGNNQADTVRAVLTKPIKFKLTAENGNPVPGFFVDVAAIEGNIAAALPVGTDSVLRISSNQDGLGQVYWRLGSRAGEQTLKIEAPGLIGSPLIIKAAASATQPWRIFAADGDGQEGVVVNKLAKPFTVRVTDRHGNPISGQTVVFRVIAGGGSFNGANQYSSLTDAFGDAKATLTLGTMAGHNVHEVQASCQYNGKYLNDSPVSFLASARAGAARFIFAVSGDQQSGLVRTILPAPLKVAVKDFYQNAIAGGDITFSVSKGNGLLEGVSQRVVKTGDDGVAAVSFQLGTQAGVNVHEVTATAEGLTLEQAHFTASAFAADAAKLAYGSGSGQAAIIHTPADDPLCLRVFDLYDNPIANHRVLFEVTSSGGSLPAGRQQEVLTSTDGGACIPFTLGDEVGDSVYVVRASAKDRFQNQYLINSPVLFYLTGLHSSPVRLYPVTSPFETFIGTTGRELPEAIQVRVLDEAGMGVPGITVQFAVTSGGGVLLPGQEGVLAAISQEDGLASGRWQLGAASGLQQLSVSAMYQGHPLGNSPILYNAVAVQSQAQRLILVQGDGQSGVVGTTLAKALMVQVVDDSGAAVENHPVQFAIKGGGGSLGAERDTLSLRYSDQQGYVELVWHLGYAAGNGIHRVEISSKNNLSLPLENSPVLVVASATPSSPFFNRSALTADSPVPANGADTANIVGVIRDQYGNPIPGLSVRILLSGLTALVTPLAGVTDDQGRFSATAKSSQPGDLLVRLQSVATGLDLAASVTIRFLAAGIDRLEIVSGDLQSGEVTTILGELCGVKAFDTFGNTAVGASIQFMFIKGSGELQTAEGVVQFPPTSLMVQTDANGEAKARLKLGTQSGEILLQAMSTAHLEVTALFHIIAQPAAPAQLTYLSGDSQTGVAGHRLNQPLSVQITDPHGNAIPEKTISYITSDGGAFSPSGNSLSDSAGMARVFWFLGKTASLQTAQASYPGLSTIEFSAQATANQAPYLVLPDSVNIDENQNWSLVVSAVDAENDSIFISVDHLPSGAQFVDGRELIWRPGFDQSGRYELMVIAIDHLGAKSAKSLMVVVRHVNRRPVISYADCLPLPQLIWPIKQPSALDFQVVVQDDDGDPLSYVWMVNNTLRGAGKPTYRLLSDQVATGEATVKVVVSDRQDTASLVWHLQVVSWVQMAAFTASSAPFQGIVLDWQTRYESDHSGFILARSQRQEGPHESVGSLIRPRPDGHYEYIDNQVKAGSTYYYLLQSIEANGERQDLGSLCASMAAPAEFSVSTAWPNPFNQATVFAVALTGPAKVSVNIYDITGRLVRKVYTGKNAAGYHRFQWDGRDEMAMEAASGIYYGRVAADGAVRSVKLVLVR